LALVGPHRDQAGEEDAGRPGGRERDGVDQAAVEDDAHVHATAEPRLREDRFDQVSAHRVVHPHVVDAVPDDERQREPENQEPLLDTRHRLSSFRLKAEATEF